ncbi:dolichol-phosphate mannosyltransferase [Cyclonatronum proteinivorum]|uniref:Dolichol-phosphate mannosyltransferase n=1 Tax=Cyclonatronum proteinivorum TaxID=1457365 RepID=A0A345UJX0_9BACT|nr:polyprenol monophosphomannose synthase [Cyclonatronum proteinivorum]AXJ00772.1 dolichol-phosphate mannosyltransferase [Cyclonatronum proteinivorum]
MTDPKTIVVIPTYEEEENVRLLIPRLMQLRGCVHVLFVDDSSPDGTREIIREQAPKYPGRIHLIERPSKQGLGSAYVAGFAFALRHDYVYICEMDADMSHDPNDVPRLVEAVAQGIGDVVIGSRYQNGISIINWPLSRLILSYSANVYARWVTGLPVRDTTAGFKCFHRKVLESIPLNRVKSNGYSFQIELHYRAWKAGFKVSELSIIFRDRQFGKSKISKPIILEAVWMVWALKFRHFFNRL